MERRLSGSTLRVPYVRRCHIDFGTGDPVSAFIVNINVLGAYVAMDDIPRIGQTVTCRFGLPDTSHEVTTRAVIAWINPRQQHPVHSLPPGIGLAFQLLQGEDRDRIEGIVREYLARQSGA